MKLRILAFAVALMMTFMVMPTFSQAVTKIAAGTKYSLFLKSNGSLWAMGSDYTGQLGDGTFNWDTNRPEQIVAGDVMSISAGDNHSLFLKSDGSFWAMGNNEYGQLGDGTYGDPSSNYSTNRPEQILAGGVTAIAAGIWYSLLLKSDGSLWAMGFNEYGELGDGTYSISPPYGTNRPEQIVAGGVTAIAAGDFHSLFLKSDGSLWAMGDNEYGQLGDGTYSKSQPYGTNRPEKIVADGVTAIAAGRYHSLFLKSDGSLWAMGDNEYGKLGDGTFNNTNRPEKIVASGVTAIVAGEDHSLFLKSDGSLWAMGYNAFGELGDGTFNNTNRPEQIIAGGVTAIAAGAIHSLFLKSDGSLWAMGQNAFGELGDGTYGDPASNYSTNRPEQIVAPVANAPIIVTQPQSQTAQAGNNVTFSVVASAYPLPNYQWQFNGNRISGANSAILTLNSVTAANSGGYSVVVSNTYGSVTSATASLAVLDDGANGNTPAQPILPSVPAKSSSAKNLVFITHGWQSKELHPITPPSQQWMADMTNDIAQQLEAKGELGDWQFETYTWLQGLQPAWTILPDTALNNATNIGAELGMQLAAQGWQRIHLIGHSAGAGMIQQMADAIHVNSPGTIIQTTFLDPFVGYDFRGLSWYGANANWSDDYFTPVDTDTSPFGDTTGLPLSKAYDVDVSWVGPYQPAYYIGPNGGEVAVSSHGYPIDFYLGSITGGNLSCSSGYGFPLSVEMEGTSWVNNPANEPIGVSPVPPCSPPDAILNPYSGSGLLQSIVAGGVIDINNFAYAVDSAVVNGAGFVLNSIWSALPLVKSGGFQPAGETFTNTPAWLAVGVTVTNAVNFVQFDAGFTDTNAAQGLLTVYWNTNQIGMVDERVAETNLQTYRFELPGTVSGGLYTLSFRLDSFANSSSIAVTNVATGFVGMAQPITLAISLTNGAPLLQLTAATNFTYLVQSSTNLVDWTPTALLLNTNGTAQFIDSAMTNSRARFYRAVMP